MTFFLAARLLARASDERDTELIGAFVKLAQILPPVLADHLRATVDAYATTPRNERFTRVFRVLTQAWAERRVVEIEYGPGVYDPAKVAQRRRVRPLAIEPSAHHPRDLPHRLRRGARRAAARSRWSASWTRR